MISRNTLLLSCIILLCSLNSELFSNNVQISNLALVNQNTTHKFTMIRFDISWENSWRTSTLESNWDAVWVFAKYRRKADYFWYHCFLNDVGHSAPTDATISAGLVRTDIPFNATTNPAAGVFIYRSSDGIGNVSFSNVQIRWNYGVNGLADYDSVEICVYAIEMVYIPQGAFYVGDNVVPPGSNSSGYFVAGSTTSPFQVTSENALTIGNTAPTELWGSSTTGPNTIGPTGTLPATYPKGYGAFYIMKYELSQQMYKEFLNKLTRTQQANRVSAVNVGRYMSNNNTSTTPQNRNGIKVMSDPGAPYSIVYGNDLNNNNTPDENDDGMHIACNWISYRDYAAFADWAGLRPYTELEYEKVCRGPLMPVANEYAWGTIFFSNATGINNSGQNNEVASNSSANVVGNNHTNVQGPMRNGCFAGPSTNRVQSGGAFYGVMEMSGNLWEYTISVGLTSNRSFNGQYHGDGALATNGDANTSNWPTEGGIRGGAWNATTLTQFQISDRVNASVNYTIQRYGSTGIRLARTAP